MNTNEIEPIWKAGLRAYNLALENRGANFEAFANAVITEHERRKAEQVKPEWKLPDPPDGEAWHRTDWTQDMLPDGYRPLIIGEIGDYEVSTSGKVWQDGSNPSSPTPAVHHAFLCTTRPLPVKLDPFAAEKAAFAAGKTIQFRRIGISDAWRDALRPEWSDLDFEYRVKPEPVLVPLGPDDVPIGSAVRCLRDQPDISFWIVQQVWTGGIYLRGDNMSFDFLMRNGCEINRNDGLGWQPCSKIKPE